jgi:hypothetical protein
VELHQRACVLVTMRKVIDRITEVLGFNPISSEEYGRLLGFEEFVKDCIEKHNTLVTEVIRDDSAEILLKLTKQEPKKCYKQLKDKQDYLIKEPAVNEQEYAEWVKRLFK